MYHLSVFLHILAASFWIGGMLFTAAILVPASRDRLLRNKKGAFFSLIGKKFSRISWILFAVLLATGITNLTSRGYALEDLAAAAFWDSGFGETLLVKLHLFALVMVLSGLHDFYAGPRAARLIDEEPDAAKTRMIRRASRWLGRINLVLGLAILYVALRLVRG